MLVHEVKILKTPARCFGMPSGTNRGLSWPVSQGPPVVRYKKKTDRKGHDCRDTSRVSLEHLFPTGIPETRPPIQNTSDYLLAILQHDMFVLVIPGKCPSFPKISWSDKPFRITQYSSQGTLFVTMKFSGENMPSFSKSVHA